MRSDTNIFIHRDKCFVCGVCIERCILDNLRMYLAPCRAACPIHMNCQGYVRLIAQGKEEEAAKEMRKDLPFGGIVGRVCHHPCEEKCERKKVDQAGEKMQAAKNELDKHGRVDITRFLRGGLWRNFLVKYDEINHMQKRMLFVSQKVHDMRRGRKRDHALDLLWAAQGITSADGKRAVPSAGALYPLELYAACANVGGLTRGVYRYNSAHHELLLVAPGHQPEKLADAAFGQEWITSASAVICWTALTTAFAEAGPIDTTWKMFRRGEHEQCKCETAWHTASAKRD